MMHSKCVSILVGVMFGEYELMVAVVVVFEAPSEVLAPSHSSIIDAVSFYVKLLLYL